MSPAQKIRTVAIYARLSVSTEESVSVARQLEACRQYAEARGWDVVLEAVDDGVSATKNKPEDRPGWRRILDAEDRFQAVIVWKVDRLARRVLDFLHADETLRARGAGLVAVEDPVDMTTAQGRAFATILAVFGEMEAAAISARVTAARRAILADGRRGGGRPPYGFRNVPNPDGPGVVLAHDPDRINHVRMAADMASAGASLYSIAQALDTAGAPMRDRANRARETWSSQSVEAFLRSPVLAGMTPYTPGRKPGQAGRSVVADVLRDSDGLPVVDESVAIMTPGEWRAMLATLDAAKRPGTRPRAGREVALLYGLARCESCGGLLYRASSGSGKGGRSYRCQREGCTAPASAPREALEEYVLAEVLKVAGRLPVARLEIQGATTADDVRLAEIETELAAASARLADTDDDEEADRLAARIRALRAARRTARETASTATTTRVLETGETFAEALQAEGVAGKRDALLSALDGVYITPGRRGLLFDPEARVRLEWSHAEAV